jgi:exonuclease III
MKRGTWNVRRFYKAGFFKAAARELGRYKLDVVGVQEVRWNKGGSVNAEDYDFFYWKGNKTHQ